MKILHYFLGFPPYRTGGMTRFVMDLMKEQVREGHQVGAIWPGRMNLVGGKTSILKPQKCESIMSWEISNPLPISLDEGINDIKAYTAGGDKAVFAKFLSEVNPDVLHIHTLMGMHKELVDAAKELGIRTVFTTHDYFGLCPKVIMYRNGEICEDNDDCHMCPECNAHALSIKKIKLLQSVTYRQLKDSAAVRVLRKKHRDNFFEDITEEGLPDRAAPLDYLQLRDFYKNILNDIDCIHFTSELVKKIYMRYISPASYEVLGITHGAIDDHRSERKHQYDGKIRVAFLASLKPYKGFGMVKQALDELWEEHKRNFVLYLFEKPDAISPYMEIREGGFSQSELSAIFDKTDVLIAPSMCPETFGFTVLEAISYGVSVIVSNRVGAADIVTEDRGIVLKELSVNAIKNVLSDFDADRADTMVKEHISTSRIVTMDMFSNDLERKIYCRYE